MLCKYSDIYILNQPGSVKKMTGVWIGIVNR